MLIVVLGNQSIKWLHGLFVAPIGGELINQAHSIVTFTLRWSWVAHASTVSRFALRSKRCHLTLKSFLVVSLERRELVQANLGVMSFFNFRKLKCMKQNIETVSKSLKACKQQMILKWRPHMPCQIQIKLLSTLIFNNNTYIFNFDVGHDFVRSLRINVRLVRLRLLVLFLLLIQQIVDLFVSIVVDSHKLLNDNLWRRLPSLDLQQLLVVLDIWLLDLEKVILNIELHVL